MLAFLDQVESKLMLINEVAARDHVNLGTQYQNLVRQTSIPFSVVTFTSNAP